jgi:predicted secreted Zn-dependent protease
MGKELALAGVVCVDPSLHSKLRRVDNHSMRPWFIVALLYAALTLGCAKPIAEPALVRPPRSIPLQTVISNSYENEYVRVIETVWLKPYTVDGQHGLDGLRDELDRLGPKSEVAGRRFDGLTTWGVRWGFSFESGRESCSLRNATIEVEAVITLPELKEAGALSAEESLLWQAYLQRLRAHEDGHVNIYRAGAQELSNEILALGPMPDCEELRKALSAIGDAKLDRIARADVYYDFETGHGAIFPGQD